MSKTATLTEQEAQYKSRAERYLAETQKILRRLASERKKVGRRPQSKRNLVEDVKEILRAR